jgi:hypothetical protein
MCGCGSIPVRPGSASSDCSLLVLIEVNAIRFVSRPGIDFWGLKMPFVNVLFPEEAAWHTIRYLAARTEADEWAVIGRDGDVPR